MYSSVVAHRNNERYFLLEYNLFRMYGEDAKRFLARMKEKRTETPEQKAKRLAAYEAVMSVVDF